MWFFKRHRVLSIPYLNYSNHQKEIDNGSFLGTILMELSKT